MLSVSNLDDIMKRIRAGEEVFLYYVANMLETREGVLDEHIYKSGPKFKVVRIKINGVQNAYLEYAKYYKDANKDKNYHTETEVCYYEPTKRYTHFYTVPNNSASYDKPFTSRMPSIIYGTRREIFDTQTLQVEEISDPTPLKPLYTNNLRYGDKDATCYGVSGKPEKSLIDKAASFITENKLEWKYLKLDPMETIDGIDYYFLTSKHWILNIADFPRTEMPLINTDEISAYFMTPMEAFYYIDQLDA